MEAFLDIKPLSVNDAWQGKRYKTDKYKSFEKAMTVLLPKGKIDFPPPYEITFEFGVSSSLSDWDNPIKTAQDVFCKKYKIDDRYIYKGTTEKVIVKKGKEYIKIKIESYEH